MRQARPKPDGWTKLPEAPAIRAYGEGDEPGVLAGIHMARDFYAGLGLQETFLTLEKKLP